MFVAHPSFGALSLGPPYCGCALQSVAAPYKGRLPSACPQTAYPLRRLWRAKSIEQGCRFQLDLFRLIVPNDGTDNLDKVIIAGRGKLHKCQCKLVNLLDHTAKPRDPSSRLSSGEYQWEQACQTVRVAPNTYRTPPHNHTAVHLQKTQARPLTFQTGEDQ